MGCKECFWAEKKGTRELKEKKGKKKKKQRGSVETKKGKKQKKEENSGAEAERKRGPEQRIFQHLFSFKSSQKNYGEFVYVEFNF